MTTFDLSTVLAAVLASSIAVRVLWREKFSVPSLAFGAGMLLLAMESVLGHLALASSSGPVAVRLLQWRLVVLSLVPAVWLIFALTYSRGNYSAFLDSWKLALILLFLAPPATTLLFHGSLVAIKTDSMLRLGLAGRILHVFLIVGATSVLMNLERTFRASVGVMRWQLKFMVIGLAALFLTRVYVSSQSLLYSAVDPSFDLFQNVALSIAAILGFVSLHRTKAFNLDLQPSQTLVYQSLAVLLIGGYLLAVGFLAKAAAVLGGTRAFPLQALLLLIAFIGLGALLLSDRVRLHGRRFVSRHLRRPVHNFREVWSRFSEVTVGQVDETSLCRATVKWIAETLDLLSVTAWLVPQGSDTLHFTASTALTESAAERLKPDGQKISEVLDKLREKPFPIDIDESRQSWVAPLREINPSQFAHGAHRVCVPIAAGNQLLGLIMVGDRVGKIPLSMEDLDLLKCVGDEVARDLARIRLSHRLAEAKELQAFQTMATFFVHDLKNTAWTLSLLVQNLREHFDRPEFREDAVRAVSKSVDRINDLIGRLGSLRHELQLNRAETDLNGIVEGVLKELNGLGDVQIFKTLGPAPTVFVDGEQIHKVILNVVMNAKDAVKACGEIHVQTEVGERDAILTVRDNGCGISPTFLKQQLFRPFQTTKKKGIGIGMFQSKMIIEAHGGRIDVASSEGVGTTFRIILPVAGRTELKPSILIVDDDEDIRSQLRWALSNDFEVIEAEDRPSAIAAFKARKPEVALVDLGLPPHPGNPQEGFALISELLASDSAVRVVVISGQGEKENAMRAIGEGAYDFFCKPVNIDELKTVVGRALHVGRIEREYDAMQQQFDAEGFEGMLGKSAPMQQVFTSVRKLAASDAPILILGESGTGKEVVALTVHKRSRRADGPFIAINCGAIPETLIESELFGHEKGAFTGAHMQRPGRIETANGGTLFLDEIGELPLLLQVKLLRFLQDQQIERIGGRKPIQVDTRVIAATNVDLQKAMQAGKFREDLFYRLAVVVLTLPPLREREDDVVLLAEAFLKRFATAEGKRKLRLTKEAITALQKFSWPGNVRELENRVKRAVVMCDETRVTAEDLGLSSLAESESLNLRSARDQLERDMLLKALKRHSGKISPAAAELGISRPTFYEMMEKLGIQKEARDSESG